MHAPLRWAGWDAPYCSLHCAPPPPCPAPQHYDVYAANSQFSRKAPGTPAFTISVQPVGRLPTPQDAAAADAAAAGVPVRFCTVEKGDICFYGLAHVELRSILQ